MEENNVTPQQAKETYLKTIRDVLRNDWPTWVLVIHNSLTCKSWMGASNYADWVRKAYYLLVDEKEPKLTGVELIERERVEQQTKHGRTIARDVEENKQGQLTHAATILSNDVVMDAFSRREFEITNLSKEVLGQLCPKGWSEDVWQRMCNKSKKERLIIAGALIAAEIDRLQALEN